MAASSRPRAHDILSGLRGYFLNFGLFHLPDIFHTSIPSKKLSEAENSEKARNGARRHIFKYCTIGTASDCEAARTVAATTTKNNTVHDPIPCDNDSLPAKQRNIALGMNAVDVILYTRNKKKKGVESE